MTVLEPSEDEDFKLAPQDEAVLLESIREAEADEWTNGSEVLRELGSMTDAQPSPTKP